MGTAYGFHIDLKFQADLPWLNGLQMAQTLRITRLGPAPTRTLESGIFHFPTVFYEYSQLWKDVDLKYVRFCVKKNHPNTYALHMFSMACTVNVTGETLVLNKI